MQKLKHQSIVWYYHTVNRTPWLTMCVNTELNKPVFSSYRNAYFRVESITNDGQIIAIDQMVSQPPEYVTITLVKKI